MHYDEINISEATEQIAEYLSPQHAKAFTLLYDTDVQSDITEYAKECNQFGKKIIDDVDVPRLTKSIREKTGWSRKEAEIYLHDILDLGALSAEGNAENPYSGLCIRPEKVVENARYTQSLRSLLTTAEDEAREYLANNFKSVPDNVISGIMIRLRPTVEEIKRGKKIDDELTAYCDIIENRVRIQEPEPHIIDSEPTEKVKFFWDHYDREVLYNIFTVHEMTHATNSQNHDVFSKKNKVLDEGLAVYMTLKYCEHKVSEGDERYAKFAKEYINKQQGQKMYKKGMNIVAGVQASYEKDSDKETFEYIDELFEKAESLDELNNRFGDLGQIEIEKRLEKLNYNFDLDTDFNDEVYNLFFRLKY